MNVLKKGAISVKDVAAVKLISQGKNHVLAAKSAGMMATSLINTARNVAKKGLEIKAPKAKAKSTSSAA